MTRLLTGRMAGGDKLRYASDSYRQKNGAMAGRGPVVVWNSTRMCNLNCIHCYADARREPVEDELTTKEAEGLIDDLARMKTPVLLFSGGEPLMRKDIFHLLDYAAALGIRPVLSTNGTLISERTALRIKRSGVGYVGVSLDGMGAKNDRFRGCQGAYQKALEGIRNCLAAGQKVGLRFTISEYTFGELEPIFELVRREQIPRVCLYHLVATGRGSGPENKDLTQDRKRESLDLIIDKTLEFGDESIGAPPGRRGPKEMVAGTDRNDTADGCDAAADTEILTVDNHADGIYVYLKLKESNPARAGEVLQLLKNNGGNRSGIALGAVDCRGNVHPDQFTRSIRFGNVKERKFSEIWTDCSPQVMSFRNRKNLITGRCARCRWLTVCNGNLRARALSVGGDLWASDPGCYLTDEEIQS